MDRLEIERLSAKELADLVDEAVAVRMRPILEFVARVEERLTKSRRAIRPDEIARDWFGGRITAKTVREYINRDVDPLPASKEGQTWFVDEDDLADWLLRNRADRKLRLVSGDGHSAKIHNRRPSKN